MLTDSMNSVEVTVAGSDERRVIETLFQLYVHDFSEYWAGTDFGDVDADGRFPAYDLAPYWADSTHIPLLLRVSSHIAGFVLLNTKSHSQTQVDRNVAEFFVLRKYRGSGIGKVAAHTVFARYPGRWEIAVARKNVRALAFWRRTVNSFPNVADISEIDLKSDEWNGPIVHFHVCP